MKKRVRVCSILVVIMVALAGCRSAGQGVAAVSDIDKYVAKNYANMAATGATGNAIGMMLMKADALGEEIPWQDGCYVLEPDQEYIAVLNAPEVLAFDNEGEHFLTLAFSQTIAPVKEEEEYVLLASLTGDGDEVYSAVIELSATTEMRATLWTDQEPRFNQDGWFIVYFYTTTQDTNEFSAYYGEDVCPYGTMVFQVVDTEVLARF